MRVRVPGYYFAAVIITLAIVAIMCVATQTTPALGKYQKHQFLFLNLAIAVAALCEWGAVVLDGTGLAGTTFIPMLKFTEFSLAPALAVSFCAILEKPHCDRTRKAFYALLGNAALELALIPFGLVFSVDAAGVYRHGPLYGFYILAYSASMVFLLIETRRFTNEIQFRGRIMPWLVVLFLIGSLAIQSLLGDVRVIWLSIAIGGVMFYSFYCGVLMQVDALTGLLNRSSYEGVISTFDDEAIFLQFDVNDFKVINDTYGHEAGDAILRAVGRTLFDVYGNYGDCFRTGGDEFCVVVTDDLERVESLNREFRRRLAEQHAAGVALPSVSIGSARFVPGEESREEALRVADIRMYQEKRRNR